MDSNHTHNKLYYQLFNVVIVGLLAIHLLIVILNHYYFRTFGYDYAVYNFSFYDFAHFNINPVPIYHQPFPITFLQDHFSLSLIIISPLYWLLAPLFGTYSLLVIQFLFITIGCYGTYQFVRLIFKDKIYSCLSAVLYLIIYSRFSAYQNDCNLAIIGSAVVPLFVYYFYNQNFIKATVIFLFLLFNREDFPLGCFFLCVFLALISNTRGQRIWAVSLGLLALLVFIIYFKFLIPCLEDEKKKFSLFNYSVLGNNPKEAFLFIVSHPLMTIKQLFVDKNGNWSHEKGGFYCLIFFSGAASLLFRPVAIIPLLPLLGKKMLNDDVVRYGFESYHGVEIASVLPILVFYSIHKIDKERLRITFSYLILISAITTTVYFIRSSHEMPKKSNPFTGSFYKTNDYSPSHINFMLSTIPNNAAVCASGRISTHLAFRQKIYYFPKIEDADYLCLFLHIDEWPARKVDFDNTLNEILRSGEWKVLLADEHTILLKRKKPATAQATFLLQPYQYAAHF